MRVYIFTEHLATYSWYQRLLRRFSSKKEVYSLKELEPSSATAKAIREAIERGTSVALFLPPEYHSEIRSLKSKWQHELPISYFSFVEKEPTSKPDSYIAELIQL